MLKITYLSLKIFIITIISLVIGFLCYFSTLTATNAGALPLMEKINWEYPLTRIIILPNGDTWQLIDIVPYQGDTWVAWKSCENGVCVDHLDILNFSGIDFIIDNCPDCITNPKFTVEVEPYKRTINAGQTTTYQVIVTSNEGYNNGDGCKFNDNAWQGDCGFTGNVELRENLTASSENRQKDHDSERNPEGVTATFANQIVTVSPGNPAATTLTVTTDLVTEENEYPFSVAGINDNYISSDSAILDVLKTDMPDDPDLIIESILFYENNSYSEVKQNFTPESTMYTAVTIRNIGDDLDEEDRFTTAFYLKPQSMLNSNCSANPAATSTININPKINEYDLETGEAYTWRFQVTSPAIENKYTAYAFADSNCDIKEANDLNNIKSAAYSIEDDSDIIIPPESANPAWLQTFGGDVGTINSVSMSINPPPENISGHLLVAQDIGNAQGLWNLKNYSEKLIPTDTVYDYFKTKVRSTAQDSINGCNLINNLRGYYYCSGNQIITSSIAKPNGNAIVFVDGNITFEADYTISNSTIVFVASGNITVNSSVHSIDGLLVAGGIFSDCDLVDCKTQALNIDGAVYASSLSLPRALTANNDTLPALRITFQPKYLIALSDLLGSRPISWREVAP